MKKCQVGVTERNEIKMKKKFSLVVVVANFVNNAQLFLNEIDFQCVKAKPTTTTLKTKAILLPPTLGFNVEVIVFPA